MAQIERTADARLRLRLLGLAVVLALGVCVGTGLIAGWGEWYSPSLPYRLQTEALLRGHLALSDSPADARFDLAWGAGGVQQAWGLGAHFWRLPFEMLARVFGRPAFPDRLALAAALALMIYVLLRTFCVEAVTTGGSFLLTPALEPQVGVLLVVLFPPLITFFQGPSFFVYEEATAYAYIFCVGLFAGLVAFSRRLSVSRYFAICALSGLAGFIRPTMLAYGLATVVLAFYLSCFAQWPRWKRLAGPAIFGVVCVLLLWTNQLRFGSPFEFGRALQSNDFYELRFPAPYSHEPLWSAARELFGSIFFTRELNGFDVHRSGVVAWQSTTLRWRHFYESTFDATYLAALLFCWSLVAWRFYRRSRQFKIPSDPIASSAAVWSFLSIVPLAVFYLRGVAMSSRYVLDFAPAIAIAIGSLIWSFRTAPIARAKRYGVYVLSCGICLWWCYEVVSARRCIPYPESRALSLQSLKNVMAQGNVLEPLPDRYSAEKYSKKCGIPENLYGWNNAAGETGSFVRLFVKDPGKISLEVAGDPAASVSPEDYAQIKAKIGLESLSLESIKPSGSSRTLTFSAPLREAYRHGFQVLYLAMAPPDEFAKPKSKFRLLSVAWKSHVVRPSH